MAKYPTRGIELVVPSNAERTISGWHYDANFSRRGHDYEVRFYASGVDIARDGAQVRRWDDLPANVQKIIKQTRITIDSAA